MRKLWIAATLLAVGGSPGLVSEIEAQTEAEPFELALFSPLQVRSQESEIGIFRLSLIYGENVSVRELDLGLVARNTGGVSKGLQVALVGFVEGDFLGWQQTIMSITEGDFKGFQHGYAYNQANTAEGFNWGSSTRPRTFRGFSSGL